VGIDYALFIVNRHRSQLAATVADRDRPPTREEVRDSIALATGTAGTAVVVAGATVVIALAALAVSGIPTLVQMGLLAAVTVVVTVLVALTLTPALLALAGRRALPRRRRRRTGTGQGRCWPTGWVRLVTRRPTAVLLVLVTLLGVMALPAAVLRLGLPDGGSESPGSTALQAYERVEDAFGAGSNGPVLVSADVARPIPEDQLPERQLAVTEALAAVPGARDVLPVGVSEDRRTLAFQVVPTHGPSAAQTVELVDALRGSVADDLAEVGVDLGVTGQTVANIEVSERLADALPLYLALVIGLSLLLLTVVFRSVVVPLVATGGFLLSVGASFGAIVAVYQWGWLGPVFGVHSPGAVFSFMPTLLIGILFGLAMDYQMFLVSGMRESYVHGESARAAVRSGFVSGARVVAAAGAIMVSVFSGSASGWRSACSSTPSWCG
jgi:RND superfamily putative drug exporter